MWIKMNLEKLKQAEDHFLTRFPGGFEHPEMVAIGKKHKLDKMVTQAQTAFALENFSQAETIVESLIKIVSRSSMVSVFEKPKFRDHVSTLFPQQQHILVDGLKELLHGDANMGFDMFLDVLLEGKLAKWSLMTICQAYFRPLFEVFVKPTTAKGVIQYFELSDLTYKPRPSWGFYEEYRSVINEMKSQVDPRLSPSNAAFSGFLMISLDLYQV